ncbi:MAG: ABC transporter ATP-binding protein/permease [Leptospiraceae bacterium]|nr:ABC transporter ATP-binding protein/permease [Leptospiraceae bacterium]MDW8307314.1 ABC transporter ATP-binding protein [Leptospiraceae bacterium]
MTKGHKPPIERAWELLRLEAADILAIVLYGALIGFFNLVVPVATSALINTIAFGTLLQPLVVLSLLVLFFLMLSGALTALQIYLAEMMKRRLFLRLFSQLAERYTKLPIETFSEHYMPEYTNRFFDIVKLQSSLLFLIMDGIALFLSTTIGLTILAVYHPLFILFDFFFLFNAIFLLGYLLGRHGINTAIQVSTTKYAAAAWLQELVRNPRVFRTDWGGHFALEKTQALGEQYIAHEHRHFLIVMRQTIGFLLLRALSHSAVLGIGGYLVIQEKFTLGQLVAAELIVSGILGSLGRFWKFLENFYDTMVALDKTGLLSDLEEEKEIGAPVNFTEKAVNVEIRGLRLQSFEAERYIDLDMHIKAREIVAITNYHGDAKNQLFDILGGELGCELGQVFYNKHDIKELNKRDLRSGVLLLRDTETFWGTIHENISLNRPDISLVEISEAIEMVRLTAAFRRFPSGLHTRLLPGGAPLSHDEKRRLLIARAIVMKPFLLLIDEILDTIDDDILLNLQEKWLGRKKHPTVIIASQNPNVLAICHRCYDMAGKKSIITKSRRRR